jgi:pilus assembly protein CpaE
MPIICDPGANVGTLGPVIGGHVRAAESVAAVGKLLAEDPAETLVVIGPRTSIDEALAFAAGLRADRPAIGVVLVRAEVDVRVLSRALQSGVREVVAAGDNRALAQACARSRQVSAQLGASVAAAKAEPVADGEIITVFAPKGGVGKTTISTNLGVVLAEEGHRVCVVDLDLASGDIAITTQLDPVRTIVDAVPMAGHLDVTGAASLLTRYRPTLHMLLAPITPGEAEKVSAALVSELLGVLRSMFRYVVVDTPAHLSEHVLTAMDISTRHVLLATPDVSALKNLRVTLDMLDLLSYPRDARMIVLNRSDGNAGLSADDVERVLRAPIAAHIPSSRAVPLSVNNGTPITLAHEDHPVSRALVEFAQEHLLPEPSPDASGGSRGASGRRGRLRDKRRTA